MTLKTHLLNALATAALLGAGSTVVGLKINDAKQDDRITRVETLNDNVKDLSQNLAKVDRHLSEIDGRLHQQEVDRGGR